jgi:uncharacterized protein (DUF2252 family)
MKLRRKRYPAPADRIASLEGRRNLKMARSAHAYVRGSTQKFYQWLEDRGAKSIPQGPSIWICGDCHIGNLGPIANSDEDVEIQIRDLDQTVIGNPAHDLIRLALSLAMAARSSDLPGVTTAKILEAMMRGYEHALKIEIDDPAAAAHRPKAVKFVMRRASRRTWKHLARERIRDLEPTIPLGRRFWPLSKQERRAIEALFEVEAIRKLVTSIKSRDDDAAVRVVDAAYWMKGCSSLGRLRYAVLVGVGDSAEPDDYCLIDLKEAVTPSAPRAPDANMPRDEAQRVVEGARHLSPHLGERMLAAQCLDRSLIVRELMPQDLKLEIEHLTIEEAAKAAFFLAVVVGKAHARQMQKSDRRSWLQTLQRFRPERLDAPSWLWASVVDLAVRHEEAYLKHCYRYAFAPSAVPA